MTAVKRRGFNKSNEKLLRQFLKKQEKKNVQSDRNDRPSKADSNKA